MRRAGGWLVDFGRFWYEFVVGDDPAIAAGVAVALAGTWLLAHEDVASWWLLPVASVLIVAASVRRGQRRGN